MATSWTPTLLLSEQAGGCRLSLGGWAHGDGTTLQEAADDLVARLLETVMSIRTSGFRFCSEAGPPDLDWLGFVWELGELAAAGGDIRGRVLGL